MYFEEALASVRKFGGYMYRTIDADKIKYSINGFDNTLMRTYNSRFSKDKDFKFKEEAVKILGVDIIANDWEVDLTGCWKDQ